MDNEDFSVKEEGEFGQQVTSIKEICLLHIRKISEICCNEFTKGYWEERPIKVGGGIAITKTYKTDQRAVFCNAIDFLLWIVYPMSDDDFKKKYKDFNDSKTDWEEKLKERKEIFREINLMFNRLKFFDSQQGLTE
jgi:hypothetical protein